MATVEVKAQIREAGTKGHARRLRQVGQIPAVLYGTGEANVSVSLEGPAFEILLRHISSGNQLLNLQVQGGQPSDYTVLIKDVQRNPVNQKVLHVDFQHVSMSHKIRVRVPVHLTGTPIGVKEGDILEHLMREIEVECLPSEIPEQIILEVGHLLRGQSIHIRDLVPIAGVHVHETADRVLATVVGKMKEEEEPVAAAAEPAEGEAPAATPEEPAKGA